MQKPQLNNIRVTLKQKLCLLLSLLLSVTLLFSFPLTSYAASSIELVTASVISNNHSFSEQGSGSFDGSPTLWQQAPFNNSAVDGCDFLLNVYNDFNQGDILTVEWESSGGAFYFNHSYLYYSFGGGASTLAGRTSSSGSYAIEVTQDCSYIEVRFYSNDVTILNNSSGVKPSTRFYFNCNLEKQDTSLLKRIVTALQELPEKISDFFQNLITNIQNLFSNLSEWFTDLGDRISGFFTNLGDNISGFFEKLWNRIYWGNENGEAEYQPPVFSSSLDEALDKIDEYIAQLDDTNQEIENAKNTSIAYVEQGTTVINAVFGVFPSIVTALVIFGVVFIFCRKVVGR